ncbi:hypothetical protein BY996DRAFT_8684619 [Phakopsora pachyrhizi]|nr:hypothetical protein BY996DRAFT_8684619 [Phakopsora pachyrhizi]
MLGFRYLVLLPNLIPSYLLVIAFDRSQKLLINVFGISLTSLTLNHLRKRGQGVEDESPTTRTSPTHASVDLQRVIWILAATPQTVIHNQESSIDPTRIRTFLV